MVDFGAAFGGLAQGLAQGFKSGVDIAAKQQEMELRAAEEKRSILSSLANIKKIPAELRKHVIPGLLAQFEKNYGVEIPEHLKAIYKNGDDQTIAKLNDQIADFAMTGKGDLNQMKAGVKALGLDAEEATALYAKLGEASARREQLEISRKQLAVSQYSASNPEKDAYAAKTRIEQGKPLPGDEAKVKAYNALKSERVTDPNVLAHNEIYSKYRKQGLPEADARLKTIEDIEKAKAAGKTETGQTTENQISTRIVPQFGGTVNGVTGEISFGEGGVTASRAHVNAVAKIREIAKTQSVDLNKAAALHTNEMAKARAEAQRRYEMWVSENPDAQPTDKQAIKSRIQEGMAEKGYYIRSFSEPRKYPRLRL